jgi:hypothetical protein
VEKLGDMRVEVARAGSPLPPDDKWTYSFLTAESMFVGGWWWFVVCVVVGGVGNEPWVLRQCIHMVVSTANVQVYRSDFGLCWSKHEVS